MLSSNYTNYVQKNINLVRSLFIKSEQTAIAMNLWDSDRGVTTAVDPLQWHYYQNIQGLYYTVGQPLVDDVPMVILSLDTQTEISFDLITLQSHPRTVKAYKVNTQYYRDLVSKYPSNSLLIHGILYPVDATVVLVAPDYTIIDWNGSLVQDNEFSLIPALQAWILRWVDRWDLAVYSHVDHYYTSGALATMSLQLVTALLNLRLNACKTSEVHDYHLWLYLGSYWDLDKYKNGLPRDVALWLYKNVDYILANSGSSDMLDWMNTELAVPNQLLLSTYELVQNTVDLPNKVGSLTAFAPTTEFQRKPYGTTGPVTTVDTPVVVKALVDSAVDNRRNQSHDIERITRVGKYAPTPMLPTKAIGYGKQVSTTDFLINETAERLRYLFHMAGQGLLSIDSIVSMNQWNGEVQTLDAATAVALVIYSVNKLNGITLTDIPVVHTNDVLQIPADLQAMRGLAVESDITVSITDIVNVTTDLYDLYIDAIDLLPTLEVIADSTEFDELIKGIMDRKVRHQLLPTLAPTHAGRGYLTDIISRLYTAPESQYTPYTTYAELFTSLDIIPEQLTTADLTTLVDTGLALAGVPVVVSGELQTPQLEILSVIRTIASYNVTFINDNVTANIIPLAHRGLMTNADMELVIVEDAKLESGVDLVWALETWIDGATVPQGGTTIEDNTLINDTYLLGHGLELEYIFSIEETRLIPLHSVNSFVVPE